MTLGMRSGCAPSRRSCSRYPGEGSRNNLREVAGARAAGRQTQLWPRGRRSRGPRIQRVTPPRRIAVNRPHSHDRRPREAPITFSEWPLLLEGILHLLARLLKVALLFLRGSLGFEIGIPRRLAGSALHLALGFLRSILYLILGAHASTSSLGRKSFRPRHVGGPREPFPGIAGPKPRDASFRNRDPRSCGAGACAGAVCALGDLCTESQH